MKYRKCEICGFRTERKDGEKRFFMARFPLDKDRCMKWVQVTGNEDLAYVPIEKLHTNKYVCGKHFNSYDFKQKGTQLKKFAIPSLGLKALPLSDEILIDFPYHIHSSQSAVSSLQEESTLKQDSTRFHRLPNPKLYPERFKTWVQILQDKLPAWSDHDIHRKKMICDSHFILQHKTRCSRLSILAVPLLNLSGNESLVQADGSPNQGVGSPNQDDGSLNQDDGSLNQDDGSPKQGNGSPNHVDGGPTQAPGNVQTPESAMECDDMPADDYELATDNEQADETVVIPYDSGDDDVELLRGDGATAGLGDEDDAKELALHDGFRCNECGDDIRGFRYSCLQCADYDLCGACERDRRHSRHYVLRIPRPKSYAEVQAVFKSIRRKLRLVLETKRADRDTDDDDDIVSVKSEVKEEPPDPLLFVNAEEPTDTSENIQMEQFEKNDSQYHSNLQAEANVSEEHTYSKKDPENVKLIDSHIIRTQDPRHVILSTNREQQTNKGKKLLLVIAPPKKDRLELQNRTLTPTTERLIGPTKSVIQRPIFSINTKTTKPSVEGQTITNISSNQSQEPKVIYKNVNVKQSPKNVNKKSTENFTFTIATRHGSKSIITLKNSNVGNASNLVQKLINRHRIASPFTVTEKNMLTPIALKNMKTLRVVSKTKVPSQESLEKPVTGISNSKEVKFNQRNINLLTEAVLRKADMTNMGTEV